MDTLTAIAAFMALAMFKPPAPAPLEFGPRHDLRDAVGFRAPVNCREALLDLVDIRAKYVARRVQAGIATSEEIRRPLGERSGDPELLNRFYAAYDGYQRLNVAPGLTLEEHLRTKPLLEGPSPCNIGGSVAKD